MGNLERQDIVNAFRNTGVESGSILMLHSDAIVLSQTAPMPAEDRYCLFFDALDEVLGADGTLVIPTFTYSATKGEPFVVEETPSTVGVLTEYFRQLPGVLRSRDPIFSVAARGARAGEFADAVVGDEFGPSSIFGLLDCYNAWLSCFGCAFMVTMVHYAEQLAGVPYRFMKTFKGIVVEHGREEAVNVSYFARNLKRASRIDWPLLRSLMSEAGIFRQTPIGRFGLYSVRTAEFLKLLSNIFATDKEMLLRSN